MLTVEQNEELTRVGPGHPHGQPAAALLVPHRVRAGLRRAPSKTVRLLGEDWTLYKTPSGKYGIIGEFCPHRRASLTYGVVHEDGIRCGYHGWKFDFDGQCVEQPAENDNTTFRDKIKAKAGSAAGDGRHGLGLRRPGPGSRAAALRRLRARRHPRRRRRHAALQLAADHGELRRPAPRRVAARRLLRVPRQDSGLRGSQVLPEEAHEGRLRRVRVRHHQAPRARGPLRGRRRLGHRPPADVPLRHARRRPVDRPDADPGADRRHHHLEALLLPAPPRGRHLGARRSARSSTTTSGWTRTATSSPTTSRART